MKNNAFNVRKKSLDEVKSEVTVLDRTKQILKDRAGDVDDLLRDLEKKKGIAGYSNVED